MFVALTPFPNNYMYVRTVLTTYTFPIEQRSNNLLFPAKLESTTLSFAMVSNCL